MITASQIEPLRGLAVDNAETQRLKDLFRQLREKRNPFFLTESEFDDILQWKLRGQYARLRHVIDRNTGEQIRVITRDALTCVHEDKDYELELRVDKLCELHSVAVRVASAVLALVYPEEYAVIDSRNWRQVFPEEETNFSISDYKRYMREMRRLSKELDWPVQEVDHAIWEYDRRRGQSLS